MKYIMLLLLFVVGCNSTQDVTVTTTPKPTKWVVITQTPTSTPDAVAIEVYTDTLDVNTGGGIIVSDSPELTLEVVNYPCVIYVHPAGFDVQVDLDELPHNRSECNVIQTNAIGGE
jgi:hypothetical protein